MKASYVMKERMEDWCWWKMKSDVGVRRDTREQMRESEW